MHSFVKTAFFSLLVSPAMFGFASAEEAEGPFQPSWDSLRQYQCPDWFRDAKFGIYAHWGVYSTPKSVSNTDWYGRNMYKPEHPNYAEHVKKFGPVSKFGYKDLVPLLTAEKFNADEWVDLYIEAGARFAGPVGEHADGFSMWDSDVNPWNAVDKGPKRDVVAEMKKAVQKRGLKFLVSMHHSWNWAWFPTWDTKADASDPKFASLYGPKLPATAQGGKMSDGGDSNMWSDPMPTPEWQAIWLAKVNEVIAGYSPDLLWFDNRMQILSEGVRTKMAANYYNTAVKNGQEPVLTFKRPDMELGTGTVDLERSRMPDIYPDPWLTDTSISPSTWSYASDMKCYPTDRLIHDLVDIVSKNGCLLLNIAPAPDGTIPEDQQQTLRGMGKWLKVNGEAIYGSRPWLIFGEGPTSTPVGHLSDAKFHGFTSKDIRFTTNKGQLYATSLGKPAAGKPLVIGSLSTATYNSEIKGVTLLGHDGEVTWTRDNQGLSIDIPEDSVCEHALVFKITK